MIENEQKELGKTLWNIADQLRGSMDADEFRDYMLSFLFLKYISDNYEEATNKQLINDYSEVEGKSRLEQFYEEYKDTSDIEEFEEAMRNNIHYVIRPEHLWRNISNLAKDLNEKTLETLEDCFKYIEKKSFSNNFDGLFSDLSLSSDKLGKNYTERNKMLCRIVSEISSGLGKFSSSRDILGDAYEYLISQFASGSGKKAGEFYTPQQVSTVLSEIVSLDSEDPKKGTRDIKRAFDFACGSGSLLLNLRSKANKVGSIFGQEKNITTYNLARMNMILHGVKDVEFEIFNGDTLTNDWELLKNPNPIKRERFDAVVANPPFSLRWDASTEMSSDPRFSNYGVAPKSAADFAFLLHGFHYLSDSNGTMAIVLPHGVLFRGGAEENIRRKLLEDNNIDTVIGLPSNLFYSTGIPVCIIVLKKCKKHDDVLFINASEYFDKGKRQNVLSLEHIGKIIETFKFRNEEERYSRRVSLEEIKENGYNLNISRYVSTAEKEDDIDLLSVHKELVINQEEIKKAIDKHNEFLKDLGLPELPL